jgi:peptide-methionine (S)-S-oxide reductase
MTPQPPGSGSCSALLLAALAVLPFVSVQAMQPVDPKAPAASGPALRPEDTAGLARAYFAGGPFWALEAALEAVPGVKQVFTGYMGGQDTLPTYDKVVEGAGGHALAVEVLYDAKKTRYAKIAEAYWRQIDPLSLNRQFSDSGTQFRTVLFYRDSAQKQDAEMSLRRLQRGGRFKKPIAAAIEPFPGRFFPAEEQQQDYARKNIRRYEAWLRFSGRKAALDSIWGTGKKVKALHPPGAAK